MSAELFDINMPGWAPALGSVRDTEMNNTQPLPLKSSQTSGEIDGRPQPREFNSNGGCTLRVHLDLALG